MTTAGEENKMMRAADGAPVTRRAGALVTDNTSYQRDTTALSVTKAICHKCGKPIMNIEPINWEKCHCGDKSSHRSGSPQPFCLDCKPLTVSTDDILNDCFQPLKRICRHCKRVYYVGRTIGGHRFYCSTKCAHEVELELAKGKRLDSRKGLTCLICHSVFIGTRNDQHYCSIACKQKAYRKRQAVTA